MPRLFYGLLIWAVTLPLSFAQSVQAERAELQLQNPDGSLATDAIAVAIMVPGANVDDRLERIAVADDFVNPRAQQSTEAIKNLGGTVYFPSHARALVAQSEQGFVFIPLHKKPIPDVARLRPWAKLKLDLRSLSLPAESRQDAQLIVVWQNNYAGRCVRPIVMQESDDPFGGSDVTYMITAYQGIDRRRAALALRANDYDWRLDNLVTWHRSIAIEDSTVDVPPGEVMLVLRHGDASLATEPTAAFDEVLFRPMRTTSGQVAEFVAPELGAAAGALSQEDLLPDWNSAGGGSWVVAEQPGIAFPGEVLAQVSHAPASAAEVFAKFYASPKGTEYRYNHYPTVVTRVREDGKFKLRCIPAGEYRLENVSRDMVRALHSPTFPNGRIGVGPGMESELGTLTPQDTGGEFVEELAAEARRSAAPFGAGSAGRDPFAEEPRPGGSDPFGGPGPMRPKPDQSAPLKADFSRPRPPSSPADSEQKIKAALMQTVEEISFTGIPLRQLMWVLADDFNIPILLDERAFAAEGLDIDTPVQLNLPSISLQSTLRHVLNCVSDELTYTIRDEVLLITSKRVAADSRDATGNQPTAERDTGAEFIQQWLKSAEDAADAAALRSALKQHLEQEFEANQRGRQAELVQLTQLLDKARVWLEQRESNRGEIIEQRLRELLK